MARQTEGIPKKFKNLFIVDGITEEKYFNAIFQRYKLSATEVKRISNSGNMAYQCTNVGIVLSQVIG